MWVDRHNDMLIAPIQGQSNMHTHNRFTTLFFFQEYLGEPVPEEISFWTLWYKGR